MPASQASLKLSVGRIKAYAKVLLRCQDDGGPNQTLRQAYQQLYIRTDISINRSLERISHALANAPSFYSAQKAKARQKLKDKLARAKQYANDALDTSMTRYLAHERRRVASTSSTAGIQGTAGEGKGAYGVDVQTGLRS
jgi:transcriptional regulator of acetoin/glycerol metabolism